MSHHPETVPDSAPYTTSERLWAAIGLVDLHAHALDGSRHHPAETIYVQYQSQQVSATVSLDYRFDASSGLYMPRMDSQYESQGKLTRNKLSFIDETHAKMEESYITVDEASLTIMALGAELMAIRLENLADQTDVWIIGADKTGIA